MANILLHPQTKVDIQTYLSGQSHALLLHGPAGMGKYSVASWVAEQLLGLEAGKLQAYPYFLHISPSKNSIGIEEIRQLHSFLQLKTTGKRAGIRRVVVIEDAHALTLEAQNSLLKNLEEPPTGTVLILTTTPSRALLTTIYSRVQQIGVKPPSRSQVIQFFEDNADLQEIEKAYTLSGGSIGLLNALLTSDTEHQLLQSVEQAKQLLRQSPYERLTHVSLLTEDKVNLGHTLAALKQIATAGIKQASTNDKPNDVKRWHRILTESHRAEKRLALAVNTKLLLTDLLLNM